MAGTRLSLRDPTYRAKRQVTPVIVLFCNWIDFSLDIHDNPEILEDPLQIGHQGRLPCRPKKLARLCALAMTARREYRRERQALKPEASCYLFTGSHGVRKQHGAAEAGQNPVRGILAPDSADTRSGQSHYEGTRLFSLLPPAREGDDCGHGSACLTGSLYNVRRQPNSRGSSLSL